MTAEQWLNMLRRKLSDVDPLAPRRTNTELLNTAEDVRFELAVRQVPGFSDVTVGTNTTDLSTYGIKNATDDHLALLIYGTAHAVLASTYRERIDRGELGVSWRSGLEEESTISAQRAYMGLLDDIASTFEQLLLVYLRGTGNRRMH
jgi:hypothetical protein